MQFTLKAIVPKSTINAQAHAADIRRRVKNVQEQTRRDFQRTTKTWKRKPKFYVTSSRGPTDVRIAAGTDDRIYAIVNEESPPHIIRPKRAKILRFQSGYKAKTKPNVLDSQPGGKFGDMVSAQIVHHPGHRARNFALIISIKAQVRLTKEMSEAVALFVKKANGG